MSIDVIIGLRLRRLRMSQDLAQSELADRLEVSTELLDAYEAGTVRIPALELFKIVEVLRVPVSAMFQDLRSIPATPSPSLPKHFN